MPSARSRATRGLTGALGVVLAIVLSACSGSSPTSGAPSAPGSTSSGAVATTVVSPVPLVAVSLPDGLGTVQLPEHLASLVASGTGHVGASPAPGAGAAPQEPFLADVAAGTTVHHLQYGAPVASSTGTVAPDEATAIYLAVFDGQIPVDQVPDSFGPGGQQVEVGGLPAYLQTSRVGNGPRTTVLAWSPTPTHSVVLTGKGLDTLVLRAIAESVQLT